MSKELLTALDLQTLNVIMSEKVLSVISIIVLVLFFFQRIVQFLLDRAVESEFGLVFIRLGPLFSQCRASHRFNVAAIASSVVNR